MCFIWYVIFNIEIIVRFYWIILSPFLFVDHNLQLHIFEIRPSESQLVFIGDKLPFECHASVTSQDKMNISWYRGDRIVTSNKTLGIYVNTSHNHDHTITNHRLVVDSLEPSHAGDWSCVVSSDKGNLTKTVCIDSIFLLMLKDDLLIM